MTMHIYTEEERESIQELYKQGHGSPYIAKIIGIKTSTMASYISRHYGLRHASEANKRYTCDDSFFHNIDTEEKAYWLGFFFADGFVSTSSWNGKKQSHYVGLTLAETDRAHIEKFRKAIKSSCPIRTYMPSGDSTNYTKNSYSRLQFTSNQMYEDLVSHGVVEHKTNILKPPVGVPDVLYQHFIRGYFDGDGCLSKSTRSRLKKNGTPYIEYSIKILGTKDFLDCIKNFVENNHVAKIRKYYKRKVGQTVSSLEISGSKQTRKFLDLLYQNASVYLNRKHDRYLELCNKQNSRAERKRSA